MWLSRSCVPSLRVLHCVADLGEEFELFGYGQIHFCRISIERQTMDELHREKWLPLISVVKPPRFKNLSNPHVL